ncbi:MAG: hypothetical protein ACO263_10210 [Cyclobacteriaceae bacterium]|jgi:hypothetical protein
MKTDKYNPSSLELDLANALVILEKEIEKHLQNNKIVKIDPDLSSNNPTVNITLEDSDGDSHELIVRIFQVPDKY